jgi:hypothetical protein
MENESQVNYNEGDPYNNKTNAFHVDPSQVRQYWGQGSHADFQNNI